MPLLDRFTRLCHDRQRSQPKEINLQQAEVIEDFHRELGNSFYRAVFCRTSCRTVQWNILDDRLIGDDHPGSMRAGITHHTLHVFRRVNQVFEISRTAVYRPELIDFFDRILYFYRLTRYVGD